MKDGELSDKKSNVKFDESKNIVKEFRKGDRISTKPEPIKKKVAPKFKENEAPMPTKLRKIEENQEIKPVKEAEQNEEN